MKLIDESVLDVLMEIDFAEKGTLPVAGGILDQTDSFLQALQLYRACDAQCQPPKK